MIILGADHAGYEFKERAKEYLSELGEKFEDEGTYSAESCDYPIIAEKVARKVENTENAKGILICGSGIGVSIAANKVKGIRAALCMNSELSAMARKHNNANILCLAARFMSFEEIKKSISTFLNTEFEGGRHQRRIEQIDSIER